MAPAGVLELDGEHAFGAGNPCVRALVGREDRERKAGRLVVNAAGRRGRCRRRDLIVGRRDALPALRSPRGTGTTLRASVDTDGLLVRK